MDIRQSLESYVSLGEHVTTIDVPFSEASPDEGDILHHASEEETSQELLHENAILSLPPLSGITMLFEVNNVKEGSL